MEEINEDYSSKKDIAQKKQIGWYLKEKTESWQSERFTGRGKRTSSKTKDATGQGDKWTQLWKKQEGIGFQV